MIGLALPALLQWGLSRCWIRGRGSSSRSPAASMDGSPGAPASSARRSRRSSGTVAASAYGWQWDSDERSPYPGARPPWPKWIEDRVGVDYLGVVVAVRFPYYPERWPETRSSYGSTPRTNRPPSTFAAIGRLHRVEELDLTQLDRRTPTSRHVANPPHQGKSSSAVPTSPTQDWPRSRVTRVENLCLRVNRLTDSGMAHLAGLRALSGSTSQSSRHRCGDGWHLREIRNLTSLSDLRFPLPQPVWRISPRCGTSNTFRSRTRAFRALSRSGISRASKPLHLGRVSR